MISSRNIGPRAVGGFSLIELMVALVAGLIVVGAVLAFTVSSVGANADFVKSARLMQELRNANEHIVSELKRAGYDEAAMTYVANPLSTAESRFAPIKVVTTLGANCVIYGYDRSPGTQGAIDLVYGEIRGVRRATTGGVGVIEVAESTSTITPACDGASPDYTQYPTTCNATSGWCPLSDPRLLDITTFTVSTVADSNSHGLQTIPASPGFNALQIRELRTALAGRLLTQNSVERSIRSNVKVRADCLRANVSSCESAPTP